MRPRWHTSVVGAVFAVLMVTAAGMAQVVPADPAPGGVTPGERPDTSVTRDTAGAPGAAGQAPQLDARADSILQILRRLPGFSIIEYQAENASYHADRGILRLEGSASVAQADQRVTADTIIYMEGIEQVAAFGNARVTSAQASPIEGDTLYYDVALRRAIALGARTQIQEGATWFFRGSAVTAYGDDRLFAQGGHFTSCDLAVPHYHFEFDQAMVIRDRILVARPARLYFGDVPVMVLPFIVQSLEQGRRSGFLTPRFGINDIVRTSSGYSRQVSDVGFYWSINDYLGAIVSTTWRSGAYTALLGTLDYNWRQQFLSGSASLRRYWQANGSREIGLDARTTWQPDERTNLGLTALYASSSQFVRDVSYDPREVTQNLNSSFSLSRQFGWARVSLGADRQQSIATGNVSMTLPTFSISPNAITLFRAPFGSERWYSNAAFTPGVISGSRVTHGIADNIGSRRQDQEVTRLSAGPSFSVGNLTIGANADVNRNSLLAASGVDSLGVPVSLLGSERDEARWSANMSYRIPLVGTTSIAPGISWSQALVRDTLTGGEIVGGPIRMGFGAGLRTDLYGFFPGFAGFTTIRHRFSPNISYEYAPAVQQTARQEAVFGPAVGRARNQISLGFNQTFEAKLRTPTRPAEDDLPVVGDTARAGEGAAANGAGNQAGMGAGGAITASAPATPEKVTMLSISTSAFVYDFEQARQEGTGFQTQSVSNTINSDFLRGLTIMMQHELFDRRDLDPSVPENRGRLGRFAPRLSSLSTSFELGPQTALIGWITGLVFGRGAENRAPEPVLPTEPEEDRLGPTGQGTFSNNPMGSGGGPWRVTASYSLTRNPRTFSTFPLNDETQQTLNGGVSFQLTPNWSVNWGTDYSITDRQFGSHRLNFRRDLHEWQANFNFFQTPTGNTGFEFYVELTHNRDLKFDYREQNLGIDRARR